MSYGESTMTPTQIPPSVDGFAPITQPVMSGSPRSAYKRGGDHQYGSRAPSCDDLRDLALNAHYRDTTRGVTCARVLAAELLDWREGRLPIKQREGMSDSEYIDRIDHLLGNL